MWSFQLNTHRVCLLSESHALQLRRAILDRSLRSLRNLLALLCRLYILFRLSLYLCFPRAPPRQAAINCGNLGLRRMLLLHSTIRKNTRHFLRLGIGSCYTSHSALTKYTTLCSSISACNILSTHSPSSFLSCASMRTSSSILLLGGI
jgi:hypothetical protein